MTSSTAELWPTTWPALQQLTRWEADHQPVTDGHLRGHVIGYSTNPASVPPDAAQILLTAEPRRVVWLRLDHLRPLGRNLLEAP